MKIFKSIIYVIIIIGLILLGIVISSKIRQKKTIEENLKILEDFCAKNIINNEYCTDTLPTQPILLMFIQPECDICKEEIKQLLLNKNELANISILMISSVSLREAIFFL